MRPVPADLAIHEASALLERGALTSAALCEALLARHEAVDGGINAFLMLDRDMVLAQARESDRRRGAGEALGALDGVPIALKDNLSVMGQPCGCASRILEGYTAPYDGTAVAKLRAAGAVLFGRTNMDEFAMGSSTENSGIRPTSNPWDLDRVPGGSSGGSAAAVASRQVPGALGSDTGGSIRQPAGFCGVVGLKPTYGRVSRYGLVAYASSLDQIGPLVRDVRDAAILLDAISGHDPADSTSLPEPATQAAAALDAASVRGLRIGLPREYIEVEGLDAEVREAVMAAAERYRSLGAEVVDVSLPHTDYAVAAYYIIATAEASANLARFDGIRYGNRDADGEADGLLALYRQSRARGFGAEVKRRIILGTYVLSSGYYDAYYLRAQKVRTLIRRDFEKAFESCEAMIAPVAPSVAFEKGSMSSPLEMYLADIYTISANLAGIPAVSLPCGYSAAGLPVGLQILGPVLQETRLLQVAHAFEQDAACMRFPEDPHDPA